MSVFLGRISIALAATLSLTMCGKGGPGDEPEIIGVSGVSLNKTELALSVGGSETLAIILTPANATNKKVTWSSAAATVAAVDANGKVTAIRAGRATVTVETADGGRTASCSVTVTAGSVAVVGVTLDRLELTLAAGEQRTLTASIVPSNAANKKVTWSSAPTAVATVDANGTVTAVKTGTAEVTATTEEGGKTATCRVTVEATDPDNLLNAAYIPDPVFLDYCRRQMGTWDRNKDGKLYTDEAAAVTTIDAANIYGSTIHSLKGIEYFTGITYLDCSLNNLTSLDVSKNTRLTELYCNNNVRLSSLIISEYTVLRFLNCSSCMLSSLDVSKCTRLVDLSCFFNELTSLDVSKCTNLNTLDVDGNELTSLDLTRNRALRGLICSNNQLTSLNLSACTVLSSLDVDGNGLISLDLSKNGELIFLNCNMNRLASLDVSKNAALETLLCDGNQLASIVIGESNTRLDFVRNSGNRLGTRALDEIFEALPYSGTIALSDNPGTSTCNIGLVQAKNWIVQPN